MPWGQIGLPKYLLQVLVGPLGLSIRLWVTAGGYFHLNIKEFTESDPKVANEARVAIRYNGHMESVIANHLTDESLSGGHPLNYKESDASFWWHSR